MTLIIVPAMYLISERLRRPMRAMFGGKWISFMGIPPLTIIFLLLMVITLYTNRAKRIRRIRKYKHLKTVNEAFLGSWF